MANVIVTDTGTSVPFATANSINSASITVASAMTTPSITASNTPSVDAGQYEVFTVTLSGGSSTFTYNYQIFNSITNVVIANELFTGVSFHKQRILMACPRC